MIVCKIFLDDSSADNQMISFCINKEVDKYYCIPAGNYIDTLWGQSVKYSSTVIGFDKIAISPEARTALLKNLTQNVNPDRFQRVGRIGIFTQEISDPSIDKKQICITWRPLIPQKTCNLNLEIDTQCPIEILNGFDPELLMKITNVMNNDFLKNASYKELNSHTPTM